MEIAEAPDPEWIDEIWRGLYDDLKIIALTEDPNRFLQWKSILRTMHLGRGKATRKNYERLRKRPDFKSWIQIIKEVKIGSPSLLPWDLDTSGTAITHALHLAKFQDETGLKLADMEHIFEFGGGYGSMCRIIHRMDFAGDYLIYDMPVISALQRFYLGSLGVEAKCVDRIEIAKDFLAEFDVSKSLFIATASLSESPIELRDIIKIMILDFKGILISFAHDMRDINNLGYFTGWTENTNYTWKFMKADKTRADRSYLFGMK